MNEDSCTAQHKDIKGIKRSFKLVIFFFNSVEAYLRCDVAVDQVSNLCLFSSVSKYNRNSKSK